jgi:sugar O-acyltransferase (sialic acid O-acetyltransferase NeuD family)
METGMRRYVLVGTGGFGREVMPLVRAQFGREIEAGQADLCFAVEHLTEPHKVNGVPVISLDEATSLTGKIHFNVAIADSKARERIAGYCLAAGMEPFSIQAASTPDLAANQIGGGAIFCHFTAVTVNTRIGRFFHANLHSYVAHDCDIGDFVTFAPGVCCNANIRIEDHAYIGTGAMLRPGSKAVPLIIGRGAVVGIGAVVVSNVPADAMVFGNPAREFPKFD